MISKRNLEETIKEKVAPLLEAVMEKSLGVYIPKVEQDISDKLANPLSQIYLPYNLPFQKAKKIFQREFLQRELNLHLGNISHLAKTLQLDRRSIHRAIKELEINPDLQVSPQEKIIDEAIRKTFESYREIIRPEKIEQVYQQIPLLSKSIAKILPHQDLSWKEVEQEFERQFLVQALKKQQWNVAQTARQIKLRVETVHRKIKKLGLKK